MRLVLFTGMVFVELVSFAGALHLGAFDALFDTVFGFSVLTGDIRRTPGTTCNGLCESAGNEAFHITCVRAKKECARAAL